MVNSMVPTADPIFLSLGNLFIGIILGSILYRGDYCMVAMIRDFFLIRDLTLLRSFVLYLVVATGLFSLGKSTNLIPVLPPSNLGLTSLATVVGGLVFGIGMVLSGGCVIGTLYKMASGNLTNWLAFAGILFGSLLYAEIHPIAQRFANNTQVTDFIIAKDVSPIFEKLVLGVSLSVGLLFIVKWFRLGKFNVISYAKGYIEPWKVALYLAVINFIYYFWSGAPMGATTAYAKVAAYLEQIVAPQHVASLVYFQESSAELLVGGRLVGRGAGPWMDYISFTDLALLIGVFTGALVTAISYGEFRISGFPPKRQVIAAVVGGIFLALGARIASGCNVHFLLGALPLLAFQGVFFATATVAGAFLGTKILTHYVIR